jgi:hypothetical protein
LPKEEEEDDNPFQVGPPSIATSISDFVQDDGGFSASGLSVEKTLLAIQCVECQTCFGSGDKALDHVAYEHPEVEIDSGLVKHTLNIARCLEWLKRSAGLEAVFVTALVVMEGENAPRGEEHMSPLRSHSTHTRSLNRFD